MARPLSKIAPDWWDYTTLDPQILADAASLTEETLFNLSRPGFQIHYYETLEEFYLAEALEYVELGNNRRLIIPSVFAVQLALPNNCLS